MNKKNKILVGCLALLLALSVGYALFSDTITINGTATAKGEFNITPECISGAVLDLGIKEGGYNSEVCTTDDETDTIMFSVNLEYPGAGKLFTFKMTNTGSINSTLPQKISLDGTESKACRGDSYDADPETEGACESYSHYSEDLILYAVQVGDGTIYDATDPTTLPQDVKQAFWNGSEYVIKPGNSVYYFASKILNEDIGTNIDGNGNFINYYFKYVYKPVFEQATN